MHQYPASHSNLECSPDVDIRTGAHSDYGSMTLLLQRPRQPGLEILTMDSQWLPVPVHPPGTAAEAMPPILVNIGDLLAYWTKGLLRSTVHRVVFPTDAARRGDDRYSIAYFCHPVDHTELVPVPSGAVEERSRAMGSEATNDGTGFMTAAEYLQGRLSATYR